MPQGWAKLSTCSPKRSLRFTSKPWSARRLAQKPMLDTGTDRLMVLIWPLPRWPLRPKCATGKQVSRVLSSPTSLP
ncbi:hypothetical protein D9M72_608370 [compost metagenome]